MKVRTGNRIKLYILIVTLITGACLLSGCMTYESFRNTYIEKTEEDQMPVITIGVFEPQTGDGAAGGQAEIKGIELANSIYSNVDGYKVVLSKVDTQSKVSTARTAVQGLIEMDPVAIIGSSGDAASLAASEYIEEAGVPTITPSATNPLITQTNSYYFRACITESQMGEGLAEYAYRRLGSDSIALVGLKNDSSTAAMIDGFEAKIKKYTRSGKNGKPVKISDSISPDAESMEDMIKRIRTSGCDVVFLAMGTEPMDAFFTMAEEKGLTDITYLGPKSWGNDDFVSMMKRHPDIKVVFPYTSVLAGTSQASDAQTEEAKRFQIEYESRYGEADIPTENAALGYDSYLLLINAIHTAKSLEGSDIREAMMGLSEFKGATGIFTFDDRGNVVRTVNLSTIRDDQVVSEYVTNSESEAAELEDVEINQNTEE